MMLGNRPMSEWIARYEQSHQHPVNRLCHTFGIPLIAGLSYEVIKWAGKNRNKSWVRALMWPGLMLQNLTTREPDHDQLEVAINALDAVLAVETPGETKEADEIEIVA